MELKDIKDIKVEEKMFQDYLEEDANLPTTLIIKDLNGNYLRTEVNS